MEEWRDIPGYEGSYQISSLGRVKSLSRIVHGITRNHKKIDRIKEERILNQAKSGDGYCFVRLCKDNKMKTFYIHRTVAICFLGLKDGLVVDHKNHINDDNRLENLQWISNRENVTKDKRGSSKYSGVCYHKAAKKWEAYLKIGYKKKYLGLFDTEDDASVAYQVALRENNIQNLHAKVA